MSWRSWGQDTNSFGSVLQCARTRSIGTRYGRHTSIDNKISRPWCRGRGVEVWKTVPSWMGKGLVSLQQGRCDTMRSIRDIQRAPQLSGRHLQPVRRGDEHSHFAGAKSGVKVLVLSLLLAHRWEIESAICLQASRSSPYFS
jgi:hypothetical protein